MTIKTSRGVYFLADDGVLDLAQVFLNSFRRANPDIPLCLIPFNANTFELARLRQKHHFSIYTDERFLSWCDETSLRFHKTVRGEYRKLAAWNGEFDEFIYIDVDTVILENIDFVFGFLSVHSFVTSHSNIPTIFRWVWKKSIHKEKALTQEQLAYAANTGFIASTKQALDLEDVKGKIGQAVVLSKHMCLFCKEQPLLNYLMVTSGKPYTSLSLLAKREDWPINGAQEYWAGTRGGVVKDGKIYFNKRSHRVLLLHWAGIWQPKFLDRIILYVLNLFGFKKEADRPLMRFFMPYKRLWKYYR